MQNHIRNTQSLNNTNKETTQLFQTSVVEKYLSILNINSNIKCNELFLDIEGVTIKLLLRSPEDHKIVEY